MKYSIRAFEENDMPFLWEMLYQSIYVGEGEQVPSRNILKDPNIEKYLKYWGGKDDHALIATENNQNQVGAIWIRRFTKDCASYGFVDEKTPELGMALHPQYRGMGIGNKLMTEMFNVSRKLGYKALSLSVDPRNIPALRMYEKNGFQKIREDDGGSLVMKKALGS